MNKKGRKEVRKGKDRKDKMMIFSTLRRDTFTILRFVWGKIKFHVLLL